MAKSVRMINTLLIFIMVMRYSISHTIVQKRDFNFHFGSDCDEARKDMVLVAFENAMMMADTVLKDTIPTDQDDAAQELFGPNTIANVGRDTLFSVFTNVATGRWNITAVCDSLSGAEMSDCTDQFNYGGIRSRSSLSGPGGANLTKREDPHLDISMTFCRDFFKMPSLQRRKDIVNYNVTRWWERQYLSAYHENQGTTFLRELFHHVPNNLSSHNKISDLWVLAYTTPNATGDTWFGCYGVACAKVLAILEDNGNWSALNADNYALFALAKEFRKELLMHPPENASNINIYPYYPALTEGVEGFFKSNTSPGYRYIDMTAYDAANLGTSIKWKANANTDIAGLSRNRQARIGSSLAYGSSYPSGYKIRRDEFYNKHRKSSFAVNDGVQFTYRCFKDDNTVFPGAEFWDVRKENFEAPIEDFCKSYVPERWADRIVPQIAIGSEGSNGRENRSFGLHPLIPLGGDSPRRGKAAIGIHLDQGNCTSSYAIREIFEGANDEERQGNCTQTFLSLLNKCDKDGKSAGGILKIGCIEFSLATTLYDTYFPRRLYATEKSICVDSNASTLWFAEQNGLHVPLERSCTCWFPNMPRIFDLFCKRRRRPDQPDDCGSIDQLYAPWHNLSNLEIVGDPCR